MTTRLLLSVLFHAVSLGAPAEKKPELVAAEWRTCLLNASGSLLCWGQNFAREAKPPNGLGPVRAIALGENHSCAATAERIVCWGYNKAGETTIPTGLDAADQIVAGAQYTCALADDKVQCWGAKAMTAVPYLGPVERIFGGREQACAKTIDGFRCWGRGETDPPRDLKRAQQVHPGATYTCTLSNGEVGCWGSTGPPPAIHGLKNVQQVAVAKDFACAVSSGRVHCAGFRSSIVAPPEDLMDVEHITVSDGLGGFVCSSSTHGNIRCWSLTSHGLPFFFGPPPTVDGVLQLVSGKAHVCALTTRRVLCWGSLRDGEALSPDDVNGAQELFAAGDHVCALGAGRLACWGDNSYLQSTPPSDLDRVEQVALGEYHSCSLALGRVRCWGRTDEGQAQPPADLEGARQLVAGESHTCALLESGRVRCWGSSKLSNSPPDLEQVETLVSGLNHACALKKGRVECWGAISKRIADEARALKGVRHLASGRDHACAATESVVRCWGLEWSSGAMAIPNVRRLVPGSTNGRTCALTDTDIWCSSSDDGKYWQRLDVPFVPKDVVQLTADEYKICALNVDRLVRCWSFDNQVKEAMNLDEYLYYNKGTPTPQKTESKRTPYSRLEGVQQIVSGKGYTCALSNRGIGCWGMSGTINTWHSFR